MTAFSPSRGWRFSCEQNQEHVGVQGDAYDIMLMLETTRVQSIQVPVLRLQEAPLRCMMHCTQVVPWGPRLCPLWAFSFVLLSNPQTKKRSRRPHTAPRIDYCYWRRPLEGKAWQGREAARFVIQRCEIDNWCRHMTLRGKMCQATGQ